MALHAPTALYTKPHVQSGKGRIRGLSCLSLCVSVVLICIRRESVLSSDARSPNASERSPSTAVFSIDSVSAQTPQDVAVACAAGSSSTPSLWWDDKSSIPKPSNDAQPIPLGNESYDFGHMTDLDDIFAFTGTNVPSVPTHSFNTAQSPPAIQLCGHLCSDDHAFLRSQGCLDLPPPPLFRELMLHYFRFVHPNLPIVPQDVFWSKWNGDEFQLSKFSLLLVQSMVYAVSSYADISMISALGFSNKREARNSCYRKAKARSYP